MRIEKQRTTAGFASVVWAELIRSFQNAWNENLFPSVVNQIKSNTQQLKIQPITASEQVENCWKEVSKQLFSLDEEGLTPIEDIKTQMVDSIASALKGGAPKVSSIALPFAQLGRSDKPEYEYLQKIKKLDENKIKSIVGTAINTFWRTLFGGQDPAILILNHIKNELKNNFISAVEEKLEKQGTVSENDVKQIIENLLNQYRPQTPIITEEKMRSALQAAASTFIRQLERYQPEIAAGTPAAQQPAQTTARPNTADVPGRHKPLAEGAADLYVALSLLGASPNVLDAIKKIIEATKQSVNTKEAIATALENAINQLNQFVPQITNANIKGQINGVISLWRYIANVLRGAPPTLPRALRLRKHTHIRFYSVSIAPMHKQTPPIPPYSESFLTSLEVETLLNAAKKRFDRYTITVLKWMREEKNAQPSATPPTGKPQQQQQPQPIGQPQQPSAPAQPPTPPPAGKPTQQPQPAGQPQQPAMPTQPPTAPSTEKPEQSPTTPQKKKLKYQGPPIQRQQPATPTQPPTTPPKQSTLAAKAKGDPWKRAWKIGKPAKPPKVVTTVMEWLPRLTESERNRILSYLYRFWLAVDKETRKEAQKQLERVAKEMGIPIK